MDDSWRKGAVAGLVAGVGGLAAGHLAAAFLAPAASPALAVGSTVIDLAPRWLKVWATSVFGTSDKAVLIGSVLLVVCALAVLGGILAHRKFGYGAAVVVVTIGAAGVAVVTRPAGGPLDLVPTIVAGVAALGILQWLLAPRVQEAPSQSRRRFIVHSSVLVAVSVVAAGTGQLLISKAQKIVEIVLPKPKQPLGPLPKGIAVPGVSELQTPVDAFYRIDTALTPPVISSRSWRISIDGDVRNPFSIGFDELLAMELIERDITLNCVSNPVGGDLIGSARWLGVRIKDLLERAGVGSRADQVLSTSADGFTSSTPLAALLDGRDAMLAIGMNGVPLPIEHGFPVRMVTPGLYGYVGATKWVTKLTLTTYAAQSAYWTERGWSERGPVKVSSRIDTPAEGAQVRAGEVTVAGVAWAQHVGIGAVQVQVDDGAWIDAELGAEVSVDYWRQWFARVKLSRGAHVLRVRAITLDNTVQTATVAPSVPDGATGLDAVTLNVG